MVTYERSLHPNLSSLYMPFQEKGKKNKLYLYNLLFLLERLHFMYMFRYHLISACSALPRKGKT